MKKATDEFSFMLKPSTIPGASVGVFATHDIAAGTELAVRGVGDTDTYRTREEVPEAFWKLCEVMPDGRLRTPRQFNRMSIEAFINHSTEPNMRFIEGMGSEHFALRDIKAGEEILMDYDDINEPHDEREPLYTRH